MRMPRLVRWLTKTKSFLSTPPGEAEVIWDVRVFGRASHFVRAVPERSPQRRGSSTCRAEHHRRRSGARGERPEPRARLFSQLGRCAAPSTIRASGMVLRAPSTHHNALLGGVEMAGGLPPDPNCTPTTVQPPLGREPVRTSG